MEGSIMANAWVLDSRGLVKTEAYYSGGTQEFSESSLQLGPSHSIDIESSSSTLSSDTAEHYSYFDPYMRTSSSGHTSGSSEGGSSAMSQVFDQLLTYKDTATWGIQQQGELLALKPSIGDHPLHQLPGWAQMMEAEWQHNTPLKPVVLVPTETELVDHGSLWMMDMPYNCLSDPPVLDQTHEPPFQFHSAHTLDEPLHEGPRISSPLNHDTEVNRKAAARKNRILLRQKAAPHQRCSSTDNSLPSPRTLKKAPSTKIPREFLMRNYVQGRDMDPLRFLLHKVLQSSDVSNLGRIVISKKEAETHLPYLSMKDGIFITMEDFDTAEQWTFRYRFWPNSRSRMYLLESTGGFVKAHHLKKGDILILWRNSSRGTFVIRGMVAEPCWSVSESKSSATNGSDHATEDDIKGKISYTTG